MTGLSRRALLRRGAWCAVALCYWGARHARASGLVVGQPAPVAVLHTLDGQTLSTADMRGEVVILTFWATWCDPCRQELPILSRYAAEHAAQGLRVLGFSLDGPENLPQVRAVAATLSFPVGLIGSPWFGGYGRIWRIPVSFVIDRAGNLADNGWVDAQPAWTRQRLERVVGPLLG
jgi:thiol-disulfide isomerase/thioredoxin